MSEYFKLFGRQVIRKGYIMFQCETPESSFALVQALNKAVEKTKKKFPNQIQIQK